jgi:hypothetical protein
LPLKCADLIRNSLRNLEFVGDWSEEGREVKAAAARDEYPFAASVRARSAAMLVS